MAAAIGHAGARDGIRTRTRRRLKSASLPLDYAGASVLLARPCVMSRLRESVAYNVSGGYCDWLGPFPQIDATARQAILGPGRESCQVLAECHRARTRGWSRQAGMVAM
jgi:hypothetical protein